MLRDGALGGRAGSARSARNCTKGPFPSHPILISLILAVPGLGRDPFEAAFRSSKQKMTSESSESPTITWNVELEELLKAEGEKALGNAWIHARCEAYYAKRHQWITIPCVVLSTLSGSASVGSQTMFSDAKTASLAIGGVSIFVGILQTLAGIWGFAKMQEANRIAEIAYAKLHRFIAVELTLPRAERVAPKDMLKFCRDTIERLAETSPLVPDAIVKEFHAKFGHEYEGVAIPDRANGLRRIQINKTVMSPEANAAVIVLAAGAPGTPPSSE